ncbi:helix-turn-helix transcriptional regulator [Nocardioides sp. AN3]
MLAGISQEYYLRLEQGRDRRPSVQVLEALGTVLQLDAEGTRYMAELVLDRPRQRPVKACERVPVGVYMLLATVNMPAFVVNRYRDVVASNDLALMLSPHFAAGTNRLLALFTDPDARHYHPDWEQNTASVVAQLRADVGSEIDDPRFQSLVGELSLKSERFRQLWARHDVRLGGSSSGTMHCPLVGELELHREKLSIQGADGLTLVIYHAAPGSVSERRLTELGNLKAEGSSAAPRQRPSDDATAASFAGGQDSNQRPSSGYSTPPDWNI